VPLIEFGCVAIFIRQFWNDSLDKTDVLVGRVADFIFTDDLGQLGVERFGFQF
jgi:hypothetical protein